LPLNRCDEPFKKLNGAVVSIRFLRSVTCLFIQVRLSVINRSMVASDVLRGALTITVASGKMLIPSVRLFEYTILYTGLSVVTLFLML
jgi:hypothetical protein